MRETEARSETNNIYWGVSSVGSEHPDTIGRVTVGKVEIIKRELSSVGSEHLVYTQGVTGSNPVVPTKEELQ